ncbi:conjugal transfer protein [Clostridium sp. 19966]|uniref:conjugal transfer protein n=1 Tax=Clostridium sp. 19966 TaxID=2768166 RepID=UPI0028DD77D8|nr:conjugal transfer protein [Clostridium sp. 19966]MDT8718213.1 conjugal transfer protein [Clostridium sp. 19966]
MVRKDPTKAIQTNVDKNLTVYQSKEEIKNQAAAFAESFAKEFLTYDSNNSDDYINRIKKYVPDYLKGSMNSINSKSQAEADDVIAISSNFYTNTQLNIDIKARVKYSTPNVQNDITGQIETKVSIKDVYLRVPVAFKDNRYAVEDLPTVISDPGTADISDNQYNGKAADDSYINAIKDTLTSFLKTYTSGSSSELSYYMLNPQFNVNGIKGFKFDNITDLRVFNQANNEFLALVTFSLTDSDSNQDIKQRVNFTLVKKDRYYIKNFDTRVDNLKEANK